MVKSLKFPEQRNSECDREDSVVGSFAKKLQLAWLRRRVSSTEGVARSMIIVMLSLGGCGGADLGLVEVKGTLTLDGQPLPQYSIFFTPINGTTGHGGGGFSDETGAFTIIAVVPGALEDHDGLVPGEYRVTVSEPRLTIAVTNTPDDESNPAPALAPEIVKKTRPKIPAVYSGEKSPIMIEVTATGGDFPVNVNSR